jgi:PAS domain S-box-containing protein
LLQRSQQGDRAIKDLRPLRVLLLEDSEDDARSILRELRQSGFEPIGERVETEPECCTRLDLTPDIILADFHQPQFDALRALRLVQERGLDIPVIVITGALGDEAAVQCLKEGAADYLLKDRLARLGKAVVHALEQKQARADQRRTEVALRDSKARKTAILEAAADAIITTDERGIVESINAAAERLFGYRPDEIIGQSVTILMSSSVKQNFALYLSDLFINGNTRLIDSNRQVIGRKRDGILLPMELTVSEFRLGDRRMLGWFARDITERKLTEERLTMAATLQGRNSELVRSNQDLDDFSSIVADDLKEPLRGIQNYAAILMDDYGYQLDEAGLTKLETLKKLSQRMGNLIDSLLEFSRVGRVDLAIRETDLNDVMGEIFEALRIMFEEHGVELRIPTRLPTVQCDPVRIGEVFGNLITNAIKYNDKPKNGWRSAAVPYLLRKRLVHPITKAAGSSTVWRFTSRTTASASVSSTSKRSLALSSDCTLATSLAADMALG